LFCAVIVLIVTTVALLAAGRRPWGGRVVRVAVPVIVTVLIAVLGYKA